MHHLAAAEAVLIRVGGNRTVQVDAVHRAFIGHIAEPVTEQVQLDWLFCRQLANLSSLHHQTKRLGRVFHHMHREGQLFSGRAVLVTGIRCQRMSVFLFNRRYRLLHLGVHPGAHRKAHLLPSRIIDQLRLVAIGQCRFQQLLIDCIKRLVTTPDVTDTVQTVAQGVGIRHGFESKQIHQRRFALEVAHIVQTAAVLIQQQHESVEQDIASIDAVAARRWHGLIHRLAQLQLCHQFGEYRQTGAGVQMVRTVGGFVG